MALDKVTIAAGLLKVFTTMMESRAEQPIALLEAANSMTDVIVNAIQSAEIVYTDGLSSSGGPVSGMFNHTIK